MTPDNAVEFLNLASDVKFTSKDIGSKFRRAMGWRDESRECGLFSKKRRPFTTDVIPGGRLAITSSERPKTCRNRSANADPAARRSAAQGSAAPKTVAG